MPESSTLTTRPCPSCATPLATDPRFTDWCPACEWNLGTEEPRGRWHRHRRARDRARVERLYAKLADRPTDRPDEQPVGHGAAWLLAVVVAAVVHLLTLAVLAGSLWLLVFGYALLKVVGAAGLGLTWLLRPRLGSWRADASVLPREQAPALHALADRVAEELNTRRPDRIRITGAYNAFYGVRGIRRRVELSLGLPLWAALTEQERIALLGHELGHGANGDQRRGPWLYTALRTLEAWHALMMPEAGSGFQVRGSRKRLLDGLITWLLLWCAVPVRLLHGALYRLTSLSSQRAEYLADEMAARVASSQAAGAMLGKLMLKDSASTRLAQQRAAMRNRRLAKGADPVAEFWTGLAEYLDSVPAGERERRARLSAHGMTAVDTSHPPTHLRIRLRTQRPQRPATVVVDQDQWVAIHQELAPARRRVAQELLGI
jgi:Zn-dependent protease with chaperone function